MVRVAAILAGVTVVAWPSLGHAERVAVVPLAQQGETTPIAIADDVARSLERRGQSVLPVRDALARMSASQVDAGPEWSARTLAALDAARASLTRLDRNEAGRIAGRIESEITERGGGEAGAGPLVEWALLESRLSAGGERADRFVELAAVFDPNAALDPRTHPEDERQRFARVQSSLRAKLPARLTVSSQPVGADVFIDGVRRCATPCTERVVPGRHFVRVAVTSHVAATLDLRLTAGSVSSKEVELPVAYAGHPEELSRTVASDRPEDAARALAPLAGVLDVNHVVAIAPTGDGAYGVLVAPPVDGRAPTRVRAEAAGVPTAALEALTPPHKDEGRSWYASPAVWVGAGVIVVAAVVTGILVVNSGDSSRRGGTLTVTSP